MITASDFYKSIFGCKVYKLSLDAGCTCPNRDGKVGLGGCIFCSGSESGEFTGAAVMKNNRLVAAAKSNAEIPAQVAAEKALLAKKLKNRTDVKYIAYFQSFTNTYGDLAHLTALWQQALACDGLVGLALATRPDCLSDECLDFLGRLADTTFVQVELGFQTADEEIAAATNRGYKNEVYVDAVRRLHKANAKIHVVTHLIFGLPTKFGMQNQVQHDRATVTSPLPNDRSFSSAKPQAPDWPETIESPAACLNSLRTALAAGTDGIKITNLYVLKNTRLADLYAAGSFRTLEMEEYFALLKSALPLLPSNCVVHRLTGDPPKREIIAPLWSCDKKRVMNRVKGLLGKYAER